MELEPFVADVGAAIKRVDSRRPRAANVRTGVAYQPGIGPHPETQAVDLIVSEIQTAAPDSYRDRLHTSATQPGASRHTCAVRFGTGPAWDWAVEVKRLRLVGNNGKPYGNMPIHIRPPTRRIAAR